MSDAFIKPIQDAFLQLPFRRLLFLLAVVFLFLYVLDQSTQYTFYSRLEKRIEVLERLQNIQSRGISQSSELSAIYQSITEELRANPRVPFQSFNPTELILKFISAALVPFVFIFVGALKMVRKEPDAPALFAGALAFTLLLGIPAIVIPTWSSVWLNVGIYVVSQTAVIIVLTKYARKKS